MQEYISILNPYASVLILLLGLLFVLVVLYVELLMMVYCNDLLRWERKY